MNHYIEFGSEQFRENVQEVRGAEHVRTVVDTDRRSRALSGTTEWRVLLDAGWVELSWGWTEVQDGIVVVRDPNGIASNIRIVEAGEEVQNFGVYAVHMNLLVHAIDWQSIVCAEIRRRDAERRDRKDLH